MIPVPAIQHDADVGLAHLGDQLPRLGHGMGERVSLHGPESLRTDVLHAEPQSRAVRTRAISPRRVACCLKFAR